MDIFILRDGEEIGPFGEETTQTLLSQGTVLADDLAWKPGMTEWAPLAEILALGTSASEADSPETAQDSASAPTEPAKPQAELATAKQKAFLGYLGITIPEGLTKEQAAFLLNDAMENPSLAPKVGKWSEDRLRLHPDLFAEEIHARKENRANHFFEICQTEGSEYFTRITKAHCQVLVGFLDVKFPTWDTRMEDAAKNYFFPAIAEKFPQLIDRQWRDRFHYAEASSASPMTARRAPTGRIKKRPVTPLVAVVRGLIAAGIILGALYLGQRFIPPWMAARAAEKKDATAATPAPAGKAALSAVDSHSKPGTSSESPAPKKAKKKNIAQATELSPASATAPLAKNTAPSGDAIAMASPDKAPADPSMSAPAPSMGAAPAVATTPPAPATAPAPGMAPTAPAPEASPAVTTPPPTGAATPEPAAPPKANLLLTKPIELQLAYGKVKLPIGTSVKLVSREGALVKVAYQNSVILVPASSTDIDSAVPAPPSASSSGSPPPAAPSPNHLGET